VRLILYAAEAGERRVLDRFPAEAGVEVLSINSFPRNFRKKAQGAMVYFDLRSASPERILELGTRLTREVPGAHWGVFDPGGQLGDPASLFFAGGSDYLGPAFARCRVPLARLQKAFDFAGMESLPREEEEKPGFLGWEALEPGQICEVRFCYAALGAQRELFESIGEKRLQHLRECFATFLGDWAAEAGGIVWIKENPHCLLLFPPGDEGMNPILAALRLLLDRALVGYEVFRIEVPLTFRFAFHRGQTPWKAPGATGTLVSEDINFIFHLGSKFPCDGQVLVSKDAEGAIPGSLRDLFDAAGDFEGRQVFASRKFKD
jgi:hypothetical protein